MSNTRQYVEYLQDLIVGADHAKRMIIWAELERVDPTYAENKRQALADCEALDIGTVLPL